MKKKLKVIGILLTIVGVLMIIGLSIWVGFPGPQGFNREPICAVGYFFSIMMAVSGISLIVEFIGEED